MKHNTTKKNKFKLMLKDNIVFFAFVVLIFLYICSIFADFISPYSAYSSNKELSYVPPSNIYILDKNNKLTFPYTYNYKRIFNESKFKVDYIVLWPQSFEKSDKGIECYNVENLQKLVNFYKKNGFKELNDSSGYLVKIVY